MHIPMPKHFAEHSECVVLLLDKSLTEAQSVLADDNDKPIVFERFTKARKHVSRYIDPSLFPYITYANVNPQAGAGDREETNNKRCLKCKGFLRAAQGETINVGGNEIKTQVFVCPRCDGDSGE